MAAEEFFQFLPAEPFFPGGGFKAAPVVEVFINDDEAAAGAEDTAEFGDGEFNIDGMLERFRGVDAVEGVVGERKVSERAGAGGERRGAMGEHGKGEIEGNEGGAGMGLEQGAGEAAFAAAGIEEAGAGGEGEMAGEELDVEDAGVNGGGEVLLVSGGGLKGGADLGEHLAGQRGRGRVGRPLSEERAEFIEHPAGSP